MNRLFVVALTLVLGACSSDRTQEVTVALQAQPSSLDFGVLLVGQERTELIQLRNEGRLNARVAVDRIAEGFSLGLADTLEIPAGHELQLPIRFAPTTAGASAGRLELRVAGSSARTSIDLVGIGAEAVISVAPLLDFGEVLRSETRTLPLEITSASDAILSLDFSLSGQADFSIENLALSLPPHESRSIDVRFRPSFGGAAGATLRVTPCETCQPIDVMLRGTGLVRDLAINPARLDFGPVPMQMRQSREVTLTNTGSVAWDLAPAELTQASPAFALASQPESRLEPGAQTKVAIDFTPVLPGDQSARLKIRDEDGFVLGEVPILGYGGGSWLSVLPTSIDFGVQPPGLQTKRNLVVTNLGQPSDVEIRSIRLEGPDARLFSWSSASLPAQVSSDPFGIEVAFSSQAQGRRSAQLIVETTDPNHGVFTIPLEGETKALADCSLQAVPGEIRFGMVTAGRQHTRYLRLFNVGLEPCFVWSPRIDSTISNFALVDPPTELEVLDPGEPWLLTVAFEPPVYSPDVQRSRVLYNHSRVGAGSGEVPVSGLASDLDFLVEPNPVLFGMTPVGRANVRAFTVTTGSDTWGWPKQLVMSSVSSRAIRLHPANELPSMLQPHTTIELQLVHEPDEERWDFGRAELWLENEPEPILIEAWGEGVEECGTECGWPEAVCPPFVDATVGTESTITGSGTSPGGGAISCGWEVVAGAGVSVAQPLDRDECTTRFVPDWVGDYTLELTVSDSAGRGVSCRTLVRASAPGGLFIETGWDHYTDAHLWLMHPSAGDPYVEASWHNRDYVCTGGNCSNLGSNRTAFDWDQTGSADDPWHSPNTLYWEEPETCGIPQPSTAHSYSLAVAWIAHSLGPAHPPKPALLTATTKIFCGGQLVHTEQTPFSDERYMVYVGDVLFDSTGSCSFTRIALPIAIPRP